jgi:hypothetical protein
MKIAAFMSNPIQYFTPLSQELSSRPGVDLRSTVRARGSILRPTRDWVSVLPGTSTCLPTISTIFFRASGPPEIHAVTDHAHSTEALLQSWASAETWSWSMATRNSTICALPTSMYGAASRCSATRTRTRGRTTATVWHGAREASDHTLLRIARGRIGCRQRAVSTSTVLAGRGQPFLPVFSRAIHTGL